MSRAGFLTLHRRLALTLFPLLLLQALTGSAMVFRGPLARAIDPAGMVARTPGTAAPVTILAKSAETGFPGYRLQRMFLPATPEDTVFVELAGMDGSLRFASLDPVSARVLAAGPVWRFPLEAALRLHYSLMAGRIGLALILMNGVVLMLMAGSGLSFWWPGRGRVFKSLAIRKAAPRRLKLRLWHRSCGVIVSMVLLFSATTGILLVVPDLAASGGPANAVAAPSPPAGAIDAAVAQAQAEFPGAQLHDIRFPRADRVDVSFFAPERNPRAVHMASIALSEPRLLGSVKAERNPVLWMQVMPLHTGESFGLVGRLVLLIEALVLAFLAISGPLMWWRARRAKRKVK